MAAGEEEREKKETENQTARSYLNSPLEVSTTETTSGEGAAKRLGGSAPDSRLTTRDALSGTWKVVAGASDWYGLSRC